MEVVTKCPICGKILRSVYSNCPRPSEKICVSEMNDCEHYEWVPVGNACYENPSISDVCRGVEKLIEKAIDRVYDGTTVWLLVPRT